MSTDDANVEFSTGAGTPEVAQRAPYGIVFISDLGAGDRLGRLTSVDKDEFANVLAQARPKLALAIKDPLGAGPDWEFELTCDSMKSFEPAAMLAHVDGARWRLGVREKLVARRQGQIGPDDLDQALRSAANADASLGWLLATDDAGGGAPATPQAPSGASVLDMVDEPDESSRVSADVEKLARSAGDAGARVPAAEAARLDGLRAHLDDELSRIADGLLTHPAVRGLETAWRSLKLLVDRIDFRENVRLSVLHAAREQAVARLIEHVVNPAFDGELPTPGLVLFDYSCENTPADIQMLDELAQHAASLPVPVVVPFEPGFFDIKGWRLLKNLPNLSGVFDNWQFAKWRMLRGQPYAKSLIPVIGRFVLRPPHAADARASGYAYAERISKVGDLLWAHGHLAMGICAARSFAGHGWPTRMFGAQAGKLEDLPVVDNPNDPQSPWGPGDLFLPDRRLDEPPEIGFNMLMAVKNSDHCMLLGGVSAARPLETKDVSKHQAALEISLPYQQFANIVSEYLSGQMSAVRGLDQEKIQQQLLFGLSNLLGIQDESDLEAVQVGVGSDPDDPTRTIVGIRLTPPTRIVPGGLQIDFNFAL